MMDLALPTPQTSGLAMNTNDYPTNSRLEYLNPIIGFNAVKQASLFQKIKDREFNGRLFLRDYKGLESVFYFYFGLRLT